jgi:hypothetical protein
MNNYEKELREKWSSISYHQGGSLQLAITHPLEWHVGYFSTEAKSIIIVSDDPVDKIESSKSIQASCKPRKDGRFATSLTLTSRDQEDVFVTMCGDIIEFSADEIDGKNSLLKVLRRYAAWLKLLQHKNSALIGAAAQKGLIGELLYLKDKIERGMEPLDAIAGWVGPDGADQDFVYCDGWHEIKTTGVSHSEVVISSVEQLDVAESGELIVTRVDKCAPAQAGAFTLYGLVHQIINMISNCPGAAEAFILKLASTGYIDMMEYDQQKYVFASRQIYDVNDTFPRIRRTDLPGEIINTTYVLSIPSLTQWLK